MKIHSYGDGTAVWCLSERVQLQMDCFHIALPFGIAITSFEDESVGLGIQFLCFTLVVLLVVGDGA